LIWQNAGRSIDRILKLDAAFEWCRKPGTYVEKKRSYTILQTHDPMFRQIGGVLVIALLAALNVVSAFPDQLGFTVDCEPCPTTTVRAQATYSGAKYPGGTVTRLRISNGGAGQSGLVGKLASTFIDWSIDFKKAPGPYLVNSPPFKSNSRLLGWLTAIYRSSGFWETRRRQSSSTVQISKK
jgi:hypothetical protein